MVGTRLADESAGMLPLFPMDPSASLRMTERACWTLAVLVVGGRGAMSGWVSKHASATAGYAPTAHFYPALSGDPSPRVYSRRAGVTNLC